MCHVGYVLFCDFVWLLPWPGLSWKSDFNLNGTSFQNEGHLSMLIVIKRMREAKHIGEFRLPTKSYR